MALASTSLIEVRATATTGNVNGGGFNPANTHMVADLAATSATTSAPVVTSATYTFAAGDVGASLYIKSGTNWLPGWYVIASVSAGAATLNAGVGLVVNTINTSAIVTYNVTVGCATTASPTAGTFCIDYSQQNAAQLSGTDFTAAAASTTVTCAAETFTPVMVGNWLQLVSATGGTPVLSWFEIVSYTSAHVVVLDRTPTDGTNAITAGTFNVGGASRLNSNEQALFNVMPAGTIMWVKNGSYTFSAGTSGAATTSTSLASFYIGYNAKRGDVCTGANRPLFTLGANDFVVSSFTIVANIMGTGTGALLWNVAAANSSITVINCKVINTSVTLNRPALSGGVGCVILDNELVSQNGFGFSDANGAQLVYGNYFHDSTTGFTGESQFIVNNIFESNTIGLAPTSFGTNIEGNTIYGFQTPVSSTFGITFGLANSYRNLVANNIFYGLATGISNTTSSSTVNLSLTNTFFNNTTDVTNWIKGPTDSAVNPAFTSMIEVSGTTATSSGSTLTDTSQNFTTNGVVANRDYVHVISGTSVTIGCYLITGTTSTTLTTNNALGTSVAGNIVYHITVGHNLTPSSAVVGGAFPSFTDTNPATVNYGTIGAVTPQTSSGTGSSAFAYC